MTKPLTSIVGVDVKKNQIHLIEIKLSNEKIKLAKIGTTNTPPHIFKNGSIRMNYLLKTISNLFHQYGITSSAISISLPFFIDRSLKEAKESIKNKIANAKIARSFRIAKPLKLVSIDGMIEAMVRAIKYDFLETPIAAVLIIVTDDVTFCVETDENFAPIFIEPIYVKKGEIQECIHKEDFLRLTELLKPLKTFYERSSSSLESKQWILVGDFQDFIGFDRFIGSFLEVPVKHYNPFKYIEYSKDDFDSNYVQIAGPSFTSAFGAALGIQTYNKTIETATLIKQKPKFSFLPKIGYTIVLAFIASAFTLNAIFVEQQKNANIVQSLNLQNANLKTSITKFNSMVNKLSKLPPDYEKLQIAKLSKISSSSIIYRLAKEMPNDLWLAQIDISSKGETILKGSVISLESITYLVKILQKAEPQMQWMVQTELPEGQIYYSFTLTRIRKY